MQCGTEQSPDPLAVPVVRLLGKGIVQFEISICTQLNDVLLRFSRMRQVVIERPPHRHINSSALASGNSGRLSNVNASSSYVEINEGEGREEEGASTFYKW